MTTATATMPTTANTATEISAEERMTWAIAGQATRGVRENGDGSFTKVEACFKCLDLDAVRQLRRAGHTEAEDVLRAAADRAIEGADWLAPLARLEVELESARAKLAEAKAALAAAKVQREELLAAAPESLGDLLAEADGLITRRDAERQHSQRVVESLQDALAPAKKEAASAFEGLVGLVQSDAQTRFARQRNSVEGELAEAAGQVHRRSGLCAGAAVRATAGRRVSASTAISTSSAGSAKAIRRAWLRTSLLLRFFMTLSKGGQPGRRVVTTPAGPLRCSLHAKLLQSLLHVRLGQP
jgi:hypothetical protein